MLKSIFLGSVLLLSAHWVAEQYRTTTPPPPLSIAADTPLQEVGQRIKNARLAAQLSVEALAEKIDISRTELEEIERGRLFPSKRLIQQINCALMAQP